jgi:glycerophosphoryl diester phosphodiesterase
MDWTTPAIGLRIGGHRGAAGEAPENTFAAFTLAAAAGVDYLELDVQLSGDGRAVVLHDEVLDRTTDGSGPLAAHTLAELLVLDAGAWFDPRFAGERVPTLAAFLDWLGGRAGLGATIEAKGPGSGAPITRAIAASGASKDCSICSFSADELRAAASIDRSIPRMLIVDRDQPAGDLIAIARTAGADAINVPQTWLTRPLVARLQAAGLLVAGGTVDDVNGIHASHELGIDLIDTNRPSVVVAAPDALVRGGPVGT